MLFRSFHPDGSVTVEPLQIGSSTLERLSDSLLLFYTGETRSASSILGDQDSRTKSNDAEILANLDRVKEIGIASRDLLVKGDLDTFAEHMHEHWENKRKRSPGMSTGRVDELYEVARQNGAIGGKLVGAGGGGFLMVYTRDPARTRSALEQAGAPETRFSFDIHGCSGDLVR